MVLRIESRPFMLSDISPLLSNIFYFETGTHKVAQVRRERSGLLLQPPKQLTSALLRWPSKCSLLSAFLSYLHISPLTPHLISHSHQSSLYEPGKSVLSFTMLLHVLQSLSHSDMAFVSASLIVWLSPRWSSRRSEEPKLLCFPPKTFQVMVVLLAKICCLSNHARDTSTHPLILVSWYSQQKNCKGKKRCRLMSKWEEIKSQYKTAKQYSFCCCRIIWLQSRSLFFI